MRHICKARTTNGTLCRNPVNRTTKKCAAGHIHSPLASLPQTTRATLPTKQFTKRVEDFDCERCGVHVVGNGYTNHCPRCLWSKHVDIKPGDRSASCDGLMRPIEVFSKRGGDNIVITHECVRCGHRKNNRSDINDDMDVIIAWSSHQYINGQTVRSNTER